MIRDTTSQERSKSQPLASLPAPPPPSTKLQPHPPLPQPQPQPPPPPLAPPRQVRIAVHVRRGDLVDADDDATRRWVTDSYYLAELPRLAQSLWYTQGLWPAFHVFSTVEKAWRSRRQLWERVLLHGAAGNASVQWHIDTPLVNTIENMADADVLVLAPSGLSGIAAQYSLGVHVTTTSGDAFGGLGRFNAVGWGGSVFLPRSWKLPNFKECGCRTVATYMHECGACGNISFETLPPAKTYEEHMFRDTCRICARGPSPTEAAAHVTSFGCVETCETHGGEIATRGHLRPLASKGCPAHMCTAAPWDTKETSTAWDFDHVLFACEVAALVQTKETLSAMSAQPLPGWQSIWSLLVAGPGHQTAEQQPFV